MSELNTADKVADRIFRDHYRPGSTQPWVVMFNIQNLFGGDATLSRYAATRPEPTRQLPNGLVLHDLSATKNGTGTHATIRVPVPPLPPETEAKYMYGVAEWLSALFDAGAQYIPQPRPAITP